MNAGFTRWTPNKKQKQAIRLFRSETPYCLLIGQGRASKTVAAITEVFHRAISYPGTAHIVLRMTQASLRDGIWEQTVPEVLEHLFPALMADNDFRMNQSTMTIKLGNGSRILFRGLDTPSRAKKILSQQFSTVLFDEVQTILFSYFSLLLTRLPQVLDSDLSTLIICTANWCPKSHWTYLMFNQGVHPTRGTPIDKKKFGYLVFHSTDNESIDGDAYIKELKENADEESVRMAAGDDWFEDVGGSLWRWRDIQRDDSMRVEDCEFVVIAFDPSASNTDTSDEHGVCVAGKRGDDIYVFEAYEEKGDADDVAKDAVALYHKYNADYFLYERNMGGMWVESVINNIDAGVNCEGVWSSKGKMLRARPVAGYYRRGMVYHVDEFEDLEAQMTQYSGTGDSPNALDSLVIAILKLMDCRYLTASDGI